MQVYAVVGNDGTVVTAGHRFKRLPQMSVQDGQPSSPLEWRVFCAVPSAGTERRLGGVDIRRNQKGRLGLGNFRRIVYG
jgi:hypothetical protein